MKKELNKSQNNANFLALETDLKEVIILLGNSSFILSNYKAEVYHHDHNGEITKTSWVFIADEKELMNWSTDNNLINEINEEISFKTDMTKYRNELKMQLMSLYVKNEMGNRNYGK